MTTRHHCGRYARVVWTGFEREPLVLCEPCDTRNRMTNQLQAERQERRAINEFLDWLCAAE